MSIKVMVKVWDCPGIGGGSELLAMLALADWSDDEGRCWPSMASIAKKTRLSRSQAQRIVHQLIEDGFLSVIGNKNGGAPGMSRQYRISIAKLTGSTHATGRTEEADGSHPCAETGSTHATQTVIEPSIEPSEKQCADGARAEGEDLPEWFDQDLWASYVGHYHELQNMKGKTVPDAWEAKALRILSALVADGYDPTEVIDQAINSDDGLLLPTKKKPARSFKNTTPANGHTHGHTATH